MYNKPFFISEPIGNNKFSYEERRALGSQAKIYVPSLIKGTINDLKIGTEIAFEEVKNGNLHSCVGLQNFIHTNQEGIPIYIFDNHDHALYFWYEFIKSSSNLLESPENHLKSSGNLLESPKNLLKSFIVLHIDQHSDIKPVIDNDVDVGNFITYALETRLIDECIQIRTDTALHSMKKLDFENYNYILDIDIDFWEGKEVEKDIQIIKNLIKNVSLMTIATSPYFMDQHQAIEIIKKMLN